MEASETSKALWYSSSRTFIAYIKNAPHTGYRNTYICHYAWSEKVKLTFIHIALHKFQILCKDQDNYNFA